VVIGAARPVLVSIGGELARATPADILPGDSIQVWHDIAVAHGSTQAPPGAPAYSATQVVIVQPRR